MLGEPHRAGAQTHPAGAWWTLETAHFRVHVRPAQRSLGVRAAAEAEAAYAALSAWLPPPGGTAARGGSGRGARTDLVVTDHTDFANAFASVFPSPRIVVLAFAPAANPGLQYYDRWLRLAITHELAHIFHLDLARGWWRAGRLLFGRAPPFFPNLYQPTWLIEGVAVFYESRLTSAGRLEGSFHRGVVEAASAEGGGMPIDAAGAVSPRWPDGIRPYAFGSRFLGALAAERGDSVVSRLAIVTARRPIPYLLNGAFRSAAGVSLSSAWRAWQRSLSEPAPVALEAPSGATLLAGLRTPTVVRLSPDGRRLLVELEDGRDLPRLAIIERGTGAVRRVARLNGGGGVAWLDDGTALVAGLEFSDRYTVSGDLWMVDQEGRARRLTRGARLSGPDASGKGEIVAVQAAGGTNRLVRVSEAGEVRPLTAYDPSVQWAQPRFSPDGSRIAAARSAGGAMNVVILDAREGAVIGAVTDEAALAQSPAWSGDGRRVFYSSDRSGVPQVFAADLSTGARWQVSRTPFGAYAPEPAGDSLFYVAYHHDGYRLAAVALDSTDWLPVVAPPAPAPHPASPPAATIVSEHAYRPTPALWPKYWLPDVLSAPSEGTWVGAFTSGSDVLERHDYFADIAVGTGAGRGRWRGIVSYGYAGLVNPRLDAAYVRDEIAWPDTARSGETEIPFTGWKRTQDASLGATFVRRRWWTGLAVRIAGEFEAVDLSTDQPRVRYRDPTQRRAGVVLSARYASMPQPAFAISPQDAWRLTLTARRRWRLDSLGSRTEVFGSAAGYLSFPGRAFARPVLAARLAAGGVWGSEPASYDVGGVSGTPLDLGLGLSLGEQRAFGVRGYAVGAARGSRALAASAEWRVPLALVGRGRGLWPLVLDRLSAAVFADLGAAWTRGWVVDRRVLASAGAELVVDLGVAYDFPVRLRWGVAAREREAPALATYATVGASF